MSGGRFFEKRAKPQGGHFFRDLAGRDDGSFHEKSANSIMGYGQTPPPTPAAAMNVTPPAASEAGGGMYGTGSGAPAPSARPRPSVKSMMNVAGPGRTRAAVKVASIDPTDWEAEMGLPTGFHRPTEEQPEAIEAGGDRFHSTLAKAPSDGAPSVRHGIDEGGSMRLPVTSSHQMGKHAAPQFLGTSFAKQALDRGDLDRAKAYASERASELGQSLSGGGRDLAGTADSAIKAVTRSPVGASLAALVAGKVGLSAIKGIGRGAGRVLGRKPVPKPSVIGQAVGGLRRLVTGK